MKTIHAIKTHLVKATLSLFMIAAFLLPTAAQAQIQTLEQSVFGMDCAPCAYGLEKRMKAFEGVTSASVSLNEGLATLQLAPDNEVTLEQIRTAVKESGFSAQEATIRVAGTLAQKDGQWVLSSTTGERYLLQQGAGSNLSAGKSVTVTGRVAEGEKPSGDAWPLHVTNVEA